MIFSKMNQKFIEVTVAKPRKYPIPSKNVLINLHFNENKSIEDIRRLYNVSRPVVSGWFKTYDIIPRNFLERQNIPSKEELERLHIVEKIPVKTLSLMFNTGSPMIKRWLADYGIDMLFHRKKRNGERPSKEELEQLHYEEKMTVKEISKKFNISDVMAGIWFKDYQIPVNIYSSGISQNEDDLRNILNSYGFEFKTRRILKNNKEIDCYDENLKFGIEYNGLHWHSDKNERMYKNYHLEKLQECNENGIQLISIFEDEWLEKKEIVLSIIKSKLGISKKIFAKHCQTACITKPLTKKFLEENHLQGGKISSIKFSYGIFYKNNLVGVLTFGNHHRGQNVLVLNRLCFKQNTIIVGGAEKLFKTALGDIKGTILSWSDRRWSEGKVYEKLGFKKKNTLPPDYSYCKGQKRYSKQSMKKSQVGCPKHIKEIQFNKERGFGVIWDCGKDVWLYENGA